MRIPHAYALAVELASLTATVKPLNKLPGCWERRIERDGVIWWFAINGHSEHKRFEPQGDGLTMGLDVPSFAVAVICNGWIAGLIDAGGGGLINTSEGDVIAVLKAELETVRQMPTGA